MHFLQNLIKPEAVTMLFIWVVCLFSFAWGGYEGARTGVTGRAYGAVVPFLFFLLVFIVAIIAWIFLVFA